MVGAPFLWCERQAWPAPADARAAQRLVERFRDTGEDARSLAAHAGAEAMLRAIGGCSPYLSALAVREAALCCVVARQGPGEPVAAALAALSAFPPEAPRPRVAAAMRAAKRAVALAVALADIGGGWSLHQITGALSDLAQSALRLAVSHSILQVLGARANLAAPGLVVLGMGKLGARELNYSSDVDLVLLHDSRFGDTEAGRDDSSTSLSTRIVRSVVGLMEARDADGYVFRTDLRLRPDPAATPPSVALPTAIAYYESMAQTWERAVMLKARPVAGDLAMGVRFLEAIRPFIWRRGLDFSAIADLSAMKRRIDAHKGTAEPAKADPIARLLGRDLKLGPGGIREIEFSAQTLQLIWGGREPALRVPRTTDALRHLARAGHLPRRVAAELIAAYRVLRRAEHRLQMVADRQTHTLPARPDGLAAFAAFMGCRDADALTTMLLGHLDRVRLHYAGFFADAQGKYTPARAGPLSESDLTQMGFHEPARVLAAAERLRSGRVRALRTERARTLLEAVWPGLLRAVARQAQPDRAFARLETLLSTLPAGVPLLSLFQRHPPVMDRVVDALGAAPPLADYLATHSDALDGLLSQAHPGGASVRLEARLGDARGLEDAIAIVRRTVREEDFATSVATLEGRLDADAAGRVRADLADAAIGALLPWVLADTERRYGAIPGGELAVVVLGKAGGREMMAGSDLDLMLVYDHPEAVTHSDVSVGGRAIAASHWFSRAVHAFVAALTAPDAGGALYAIDMRLRPSGNKGPVAVSRAAFAQYHRPGGEAWTWERMALTRARIVAGPPGLRGVLEQLIRGALQGAGDPRRVRADARDMRERLWRDARPPGPPFALSDTKLRPGGLVEVEFCAQVLQLVTHGDPPPCSTNTIEALTRLADAGVLPLADATLLIEADRAFRTVLGMIRLTAGKHGDAALSGAAAEAVLHAARRAGMDALDLPALHVTLDRMAVAVRELFARHVGSIEEETTR